jgi:hypothetical protein
VCLFHYLATAIPNLGTEASYWIRLTLRPSTVPRLVHASARIRYSRSLRLRGEPSNPALCSLSLLARTLLLPARFLHLPHLPISTPSSSHSDQVVVRDPETDRTIECYVDQDITVEGTTYSLVRARACPGAAFA